MLLIENDAIKVELEDGILYGKWKTLFIDLKIAQDVITQRVNAQNGISYPLIINIASVKNSSKEARDLLSSEKGCEGVIAAAIIIDSIVGKMLGTFFISINRPRIPSKLFTNEQEAKKWISQFVKQFVNENSIVR